MGKPNKRDGMEYEDLPFKINKTKLTRKGGKAKTMATTNKETSTAKAKKYSKTRGEHLKDMVIVALVTAIISFGIGMAFANGQNDKVDAAVTEAMTTETVTAEAVETPVKK